jgi:hypothetical protein
LVNDEMIIEGSSLPPPASSLPPAAPPLRPAVEPPQRAPSAPRPTNAAAARALQRTPMPGSAEALSQVRGTSQIQAPPKPSTSQFWLGFGIGVVLGGLLAMLILRA